MPAPSITSTPLGSGIGSGGTAVGPTTNANPVIRSETKPETFELTAKSGSSSRGPLKSTRVPLEALAKLASSAERKPWSGVHSFPVLSRKATEYGIGRAMAGAANSRHNNVTRDKPATRAFMLVLPIRGLGSPEGDRETRRASSVPEQPVRQCSGPRTRTPQLCFFPCRLWVNYTGSL